MRYGLLVVASVAGVLAVATPVQGQGKGKGFKGHPPSHSPLPSPTVVASPTAGTAPFAWIDDATVLPPGALAVSVSLLRWQGTDVSEVNAPVLGMAWGWTPRVQVGASVPRVVGDEISGVVGGLGTSYVGAKVALTDGPSRVKLAVAPTLEILGAGALPALPPDASRTQLGLPVSVEIDGRATHAFASTGFFSHGVWFAGGGLAAQITPRVGVSAAFSRAWTTDSTDGIGGRAEISGSVVFSPRPQLALFGSLGRTVATADQDGAGTTLTGGVMFLRVPSILKKPTRHHGGR